MLEECEGPDPEQNPELKPGLGSGTRNFGIRNLNPKPARDPKPEPGLETGTEPGTEIRSLFFLLHPEETSYEINGQSFERRSQIPNSSFYSK